MQTTLTLPRCRAAPSLWAHAIHALQHGIRALSNRPPASVQQAFPEWVTTVNWKRLLCFVHIPKTAGVSLNYALWQVYGSTFLKYHQVHDPVDFGAFTKHRADQVLAISGHLPFGFHSQFGDGTLFDDRDRLYVSMVRNPVDRLISMYHYIRAMPNHPQHEVVATLDFAAYCASLQDSHADNPQSRFLTGGEEDDSIHFIRSNYLAVATIESSRRLVSALADILDWPTVEMPRKNVTPSYHSNMSEREIAADFASKRQASDIMLYEFISSQPTGLLLNAALADPLRLS